MYKLSDILSDVQILGSRGDTGVTVNGIAFDSREVTGGDVFVAVKGTQADGHKFIPQAAGKGAVAIIYEDNTVETDDSLTWIHVPDSAEALGLAASAFFGHPSAKLSLVGVTGTNGKTTVVTLLHDVFSRLGYPAGLLSTIENKIAGQKVPATHTTPDPVQLNRLLAEMVNHGVSHCFMEVSSHAVAQHRISGLEFSGAVFTNLTRDHLDYHGDFSSYRDAKKSFFDGLPASAFALVNVDDRNGAVMVQNTKARVSRYSLRSMAEFRARVLEHDFSGMKLDLNSNEFWSRLIGRFNAYNLLAIYGTARLCGFSDEELLPALSQLHPARGRFEYLSSPDNIHTILDYAHTPDALGNVLDSIGQVRTGQEQLVTIIGAGGNRDKGKRPLMAEVAARLSDKVILTSDNPRDEDPEDIIDDMMEGITADLGRKVLRISDRREAIRTAAMLARPGDIILLAGKGHETYQEVRGEKHPFNDLLEIKNAFGIND